MTGHVEGALWLAVCYLVGGISTGYYVVRWKTGMDVRDVGSGGAGGTNVGSILGVRGMLAVGLVDAGKAALVVGGAAGAGVSGTWLTMAASATVVGNVLPVQHGWRGGKGVATSLGALAVALPLAALWVVVLGVAVGALARDRMAGGYVAYGTLPLVAMPLELPMAGAACLAAVAGAVLWALRRPRRGSPRAPARQGSNSADRDVRRANDVASGSGSGCNG